MSVVVVVPPFVAREIEHRRFTGLAGVTKSDGLILMDVFRDLNANASFYRSDEEGPWNEGEFFKWMQDSNNYVTFTQAVNDGYLIEVTTYYYLKHIDMSHRNSMNDFYLMKQNYLELTDEEECRLTHGTVSKGNYPPTDDFKFTEKELSDMNIGSYTKIKVTNEQ